jgi:hypothetical protein
VPGVPIPWCSQNDLVFLAEQVITPMKYIIVVLCSVVDQHPNFHVDSDPDPDWHQNNADPHADPTTSLTHVEKS